MCQRRRQRRPFDGSRRPSGLGRSSEGLSFSAAPEYPLAAASPAWVPPARPVCRQVRVLDQDGLEVRSSGVGIDLGASAHVIGFAKVLKLVGVTGDDEDHFFFDENGVALSRGLDWMAMPRRRPMAAEPVFRALRARGTLPQKID